MSEKKIEAVAKMAEDDLKGAKTVAE